MGAVVADHADLLPPRGCCEGGYSRGYIETVTGAPVRAAGGRCAGVGVVTSEGAEEVVGPGGEGKLREAGLALPEEGRPKERWGGRSQGGRK